MSLQVHVPSISVSSVSELIEESDSEPSPSDIDSYDPKDYQTKPIDSLHSEPELSDIKQYVATRDLLVFKAP